MLLKLGEVPTLVVSSPEAAAEIMKTQDVSFASRPMISSVRIIAYGDKSPAFASYGSYWREIRKMSILELLSIKRVLSFRSIREEEVLNFVRSMDLSSNSGCTVNLSGKFALMTNYITATLTARAIIGRKFKYQKQFLQVLNRGLEASGGFSLADLFPSSSLVSLLSGMSLKLPRLHREMDAILSSIIREHRERNSTEQVEEDLVDVLLKVQREGSLPFAFTDVAVKAIILDLFGAGGETTATTLEWIISELMRNPGAMKRVQQEVRVTVGGKGRVREEDINEMNYLRMIIKETLRLHPPLPLLLPRECQDQSAVAGEGTRHNGFLLDRVLGRRDPS
ncbi:germacrene A hydroxylase-like [Musa acuminata AAA Group]|uniref:germacrene A hydroxylase-like n=1 Tax=Musa acuminata AAA Group TaxID=214697 RepID=UPI0031CE9C2A